MRNAIALTGCLILTVVAGCQSSSPRGGGPSRDEGFHVDMPAGTTTVKQGEVQTVTLSLRRGDYFKRDVTLEITGAKGLGVDPTNYVVRAGDKPDVQVRVSANRDAPLGDYRVKVKATPQTGDSTSGDFVVRVVAR